MWSILWNCKCSYGCYFFLVAVFTSSTWIPEDHGTQTLMRVGELWGQLTRWVCTTQQRIAITWKLKWYKKNPQFQEEKISERRKARCQVTLEKSSKNYISLFGRKPARGLPTPPPHLSGSHYHTFYMWWVASATSTRKILSRGRAGWFAKRCHSLTDHRINCKLKTKIANTILLLCYFDKICLSLTGGLWQALANLYSEESYKREPEPAGGPQSTTLHSTVNTSVKMEVCHSNTHGIVRLCSFPHWNTAAHSLHFQHLVWTKGYRFKTCTVKRSLISFVHIDS